jgi:hypothetical protein
MTAEYNKTGIMIQTIVGGIDLHPEPVCAACNVSINKRVHKECIGVSNDDWTYLEGYLSGALNYQYAGGGACDYDCSELCRS